MSVRARQCFYPTIWSLAALCALVLPAAGCRSAGPIPEGELAASAVRDPILVDIPKPQGFQLVDNDTTAFASGKFRVARCQYVGGTPREAIKRFYEQYMPQARFTLREWRLIGGVYDMRFESNAEICTVQISIDRGRTVLVVEITPRSQGTADRDAEPLMRRGQ